MTKITSPQLHRGDNADLQFGACVIGVIREVRRSMRALAESRRADEAAPGAIYALQKLCEGNDGSNVFTQEAEQWQATFFAWLDRVQRHIPQEHRQAYRANAEEAFRVILAASHHMPESLWRNDANQRHLLISFANDEAFRRACDAADRLHPVSPGHALSKYLQRCARELTDDSVAQPVAVEPPPPKKNNSFTPKYLLGADSTHSLLVTEFDCFQTAEDLEQNNVATAYDVEKAVKRRLTEQGIKLGKQVRFDCESSMFCVRSKDLDALSRICQVLLELAISKEV